MYARRILCVLATLLALFTLFVPSAIAAETEEVSASSVSGTGDDAAADDAEDREGDVSDFIGSDGDHLDIGDRDLRALASGDLSGGAYFIADCALGRKLRFYVPYEYASDVFSVDASGTLISLSNSSVYVYCPSFPDYTIYFSRFSSAYYRTNSSSTRELTITNVDLEASTVSFASDGKQISVDRVVLFIAIISVFILLCNLIFRR